MSDFFHSISQIAPPFNMVVFVVLIGSIAGVIGTIATQVRRYANHRADIQLKRELVERGLSAEEIERIVAANSPDAVRSDDH
ncbi:MAG TPA: hypothetical protein VHE81_01795 [Lacipirellulaceae bacterium]|nr:hypothetical protein [Lacipirellulaceae bacterium]